MRKGLFVSVFALFVLACVAPALAQESGPYPRMAPVEAYMMERDAEIALARSAAPPPIADHATVLVLGARGFETAVEGSNGFVCLVERSWSNNFSNDGFWNPNVRGPICFNPPAVRTILPTRTTRTEWVLAGVPKDEMERRTQAAILSAEIPPPEAGAMSYMLSKHGYLNDRDRHGWVPHVMFHLPRTQASLWGANLDERGPIYADEPGIEPMTTFNVAVPRWSDGTPSPHAH